MRLRDEIEEGYSQGSSATTAEVASILEQAVIEARRRVAPFGENHPAWPLIHSIEARLGVEYIKIDEAE